MKNLKSIINAMKQTWRTNDGITTSVKVHFLSEPPV